jgi:ATP-binding cassette subfamily B protein RaxB
MSDLLELGFFGRKRVALVRQSESAECGLACLAMVAGYHGLDIDLGSLRRRFPPSQRGATLKTLMEVADGIGLTPRAVKLGLDRLRDLQLPAVLHWDMSHFVVLERVEGSGDALRALVHNPDGRTAWLPLAEVSAHFTGVALELRPGAGFERGDQRQTLRLWQLWGKASGLKSSLAQVLVLSVLLQVVVLASPYYLQIAIDSALPAMDADLLVVLAVGFALLVLVEVAAETLRAFVLLAASSSLSFGIASNVVRHLLRLPVDWFGRRDMGDVLSRFQSINPVQNVLTSEAVQGLIDGVMTIAVLALMYWYSPLLAGIATFAFVVYATTRVMSFEREREAVEASIVFRGKEQSSLMESIRGITTLRLFGRETLRHAAWQARMADAVNADVRGRRIAIWNHAWNVLIFGIENVVLVWLAVRMVMSGEGFSLGMLFAFMAYKRQFSSRGAELVAKWIAFRKLRLHLERLSDIALATEDRGVDAESGAREPLAGAVALRGIHFRYGVNDPPVLRGLDLSVAPGEHVVITGPSGGGKSTVMKLLLGLVVPESGELVVDGISAERYGLRAYRAQVAAVMQEDSLFTGSLAENIALFDDAIDMERVVEVAKVAAIHDEINAMPMRYETLVGDMGSTLSGGQKQRVLLARALYRRPRVLFIDEGTSHLDGERERQITAAIAAMGITRISVAHRQETVVSADRVLELREGRLFAAERRSGDSNG